MKFYFAPMEGITGYTYRNAYHYFFRKADKYFAPFIAANQNNTLRTREKKDILPENNSGIYLVPQILSNHAKDFIHTSRILKEYGYDEVNLNLGCPAATVVTKGKGAGFLVNPEKLHDFLDEIFEASITEISIKTRIGMKQPEEFEPLLELFNQYPIKELIIHPRVQKDMYKNKPNYVVFQNALKKSTNPIVYNGDLFTVDAVNQIAHNYPSVNTIMMGRGVLANPQLPAQIIDSEKTDKQRIQEFIHKLVDDYSRELSGDKDVLFRLKELWFYMIKMFTDYEPYQKKLRKADRLSAYIRVIDHLFDEQEIINGAGFYP